MSAQHQCFICLSKIVVVNRKKSNSIDQLVFNSDFELDPQLDVIFILRHILQLKSEQLHGFLRRCGNPQDWIELCEKCKEQVCKIRGIFLRLQEISREFEKEKWEIQEKIRSSEERRPKEKKAPQMKKKKKNRNGRRRKLDEEDDVTLTQDVYDCRKVICGGKRQLAPTTLNPFLQGDLMAAALEKSVKTRNQITTSSIDVDINVVDDNIQVKNEPLLEADIFPEDEDVSSPVWNADSINSDNDPEDEAFFDMEPEPELSDVKTFSYEEPVNVEDISSGGSGLRRSARCGTGSSKRKTYFEEDNDDDDELEGCKKMRKTGEDNSSSTTPSPAEEGEGDVDKSSVVPRLQKASKCEACGAVYANDSFLRRHLRQAHGIIMEKPVKDDKKPRPFICTERGCNRAFYTKCNLVWHIKLKHLKQAMSEGSTCACGRRFWLQETFNRHSKICTKIKLKCFLCDETFVSLKKFQEHKRKVHGIKGDKDEGIKDDGNGGGKIFVKSGVQSCTCKECGKTFKNKASLAVHYSKSHRHPNQNEYCCDDCGRKFSQVISLKLHLARLHGIGDFKCDHENCTEVFAINDHLLRHKSIWHDPNVIGTSKGGRPKTITGTDLKCRFCKKTFNNRDLRNAHIRRVHERDSESESDRVCQFCGKRYTTQHALRHHLASAHQVGEHECSECGDVYPGKIYLKRHMFEKHGVEPVIPLPPAEEITSSNLKCQFCDQIFAGQSALSLHKRLVHMTKSKNVKNKYCELCGVCRSGYGLRYHMASIHKIGDFKCSVDPDKCDRVFAFEKDLEDHVKRIHLKIKRDKPHICDICGRGFQAPYYLRLHEKCVHLGRGSRRFMCDICGHHFDAERYYRQHYRQVHNADPGDKVKEPEAESENNDNDATQTQGKDVQDSTLKCQVCGKIMKTAQGLGSHLKHVHHANILPPEKAEDPQDDGIIYNCSICNEPFKTPRAQFMHERRIHKVTISCDICGSEWQNRALLRRHQANKHNMGEFKCLREDCDKSFISQKELDDHVKFKHEGVERPRDFHCSFCPKAFESLGNLQKHELSVHLCKGSKHMICEVCGKGYDTDKNYKRHQKSVHGIVNTNRKKSGNVKVKVNVDNNNDDDGNNEDDVKINNDINPLE